MAALRDSRRRLDELRAYPDLIEEYLSELPYLVHAKDMAVCDYAHTEEHEECKKKAREEGCLPILPVSPEMVRGRTPEETEKVRRERNADAPNATGAYTLVLVSESPHTKTVPWS